jgi:prolyl-tRNA synthetase
MGSYGIGLERNMAAIIETHHDDNGIVWPVAVAPWEVVITVVKVDDEASMRAAEDVYAVLQGEGIDVILDDRKERPGVKFNDAELVGIPYRITIGPRGLATGEAEFTTRATGETENVALAEIAAKVTELVQAQR